MLQYCNFFWGLCYAFLIKVTFFSTLQAFASIDDLKDSLFIPHEQGSKSLQLQSQAWRVFTYPHYKRTQITRPYPSLPRYHLQDPKTPIDIADCFSQLNEITARMEAICDQLKETSHVNAYRGCALSSNFLADFGYFTVLATSLILTLESSVLASDSPPFLNDLALASEIHLFMKSLINLRTKIRLATCKLRTEQYSFSKRFQSDTFTKLSNSIFLLEKIRDFISSFNILYEDWVSGYQHHKTS